MNKKKRDIDFFRGNIDNEDPNNNDNLDEEFTHSDFNFNKKNKKIDPEILDQKIKAEELKRARYLRRKREEELLRQEELEKENFRKRQEYIKQDSNISSGARKPLKPLKEEGKSNVIYEKPKKINHKVKNKNKKSKKKAKIIAIIIAILLALLILLAIVLFVIKNTAKPLDVVVIGVDQRTGQKDSEIRADALMNITVGSKDNEVLIASIPRDTYTYIPCEGYEDKITHAYAYGAINWEDKGGGIGCTVESVNGLLKTDTDKYAKINFDQMIDIVNAMGGIDLKATATFCEQNSKGKKDKKNRLCFEKGKTYKMDGEQALAYSRHRKSDNDIERGLRQQEVFNAMIKKVKSQNIFMWPIMFGQLSRIVDTNLNTFQMLQFALVYLTNGKTSTYKFDWEGFYANGVAYVKLGDDSLLKYQMKIKDLK